LELGLDKNKLALQYGELGLGKNKLALQCTYFFFKFKERDLQCTGMVAFSKHATHYSLW